ncbi:MAG TPA: serine hydrolase domain-containing protein [Bacteroidales bacterium]|nr:serine hydrolase domain-containing protein [Bacteroidales bacterium]
MSNVKHVFLFLVLFCNFFPSGYSQNADLRDEVITDSLENGSYSFPLSLDSGRFVYGYVNQLETDLSVELINPKGEIITVSDVLVRGRESFTFDSNQSGKYEIKLKGDRGAFELKIVRNEPIAARPEERVNQWLSPYRYHNSPGVAVLVLKGQEVLLESYAGMANLSYDVKMAPSTRHNIGSTSKHFTAFGLMLLVEQNKVSLSDDIRKYIPELPKFSDTVRIHHLLTHTSGYREFLNTILMMGQHPSTPLSRDKIITIIKRQPELQDQPGTAFNYNNTAFVLITEVIERVTGKPFETYMRDAVFKPLEMDQTQFRSHNQEVIPFQSVGYSPSDENGYQAGPDLGGGMGAGGLYLTLSDFKKWLDHLQSPEICSPAIIDRMTTPDTLSNGQSTGYGLGLFIQEYKGQRYIHHGGADLAHRSHMLYFPDIPAAVVVQSNMSSFEGNLPLKIANLYFQDYFKVEEKESPSADTSDDSFTYNAKQFEPLKGRYALNVATSFILRFFTEEEKLMTQATGQPALELKALNDSTFNIIAVPNASLTFHLKEDGSADSLTLHQGGDLKATRLYWSPDSSQLDEYLGTFYSNELETVVQVEKEENQLKIHHYRFNEPFNLAAIDKDKFSSTDNIGAFGEIEYHRNENGKINGMLVSNGRTKGVWFQLIPKSVLSSSPKNN